ncbi:MAG: segregation/condensation protein A [Tuberibacillus sp.]
MEYKVKIDAFEGPLDLLLHLIKKMEIDIYDIQVAEITEQYLEFIHDMKELQLDIASEYLVMAATLIEMKSRMLLPKPEPINSDMDDVDFDDGEDPREELIRRLIEYRQYKQAAEVLKEKEETRLLVYTKPPSDLSEYEKPREIQLTGVTLYDMLAAFRHLMQRKKLDRPMHTKIQRQEIPIGERMEAIVHNLRSVKKPVAFDSLFPYPNRTHVVVTFLALLELMKKRTIACVQQHNFEQIMIYLVEERFDSR